MKLAVEESSSSLILKKSSLSKEKNQSSQSCGKGRKFAHMAASQPQRLIDPINLALKKVFH